MLFRNKNVGSSFIERKFQNTPNRFSIFEAVLVGLITVFGYAMLLIGAWYSYPAAEDFEIACGSRDAGIMSSMVALMVNYDGRYSTNFLHAINPLVFNWIRGYGIMNLLGVVLSNWGLYCFMLLFLKARSRLIIFLYSAFVTVLFMGCVLFFATFFQMTGNFVYLYSGSFALFFVTVLIHYLKEPDGLYENLYFTLSSLTLIVGIGFCELFLPFYTLLLSAILLYLWYTDKPRLKKFLPVYLLGISSVIFFVATPGVSLHLKTIETNISGWTLFNVLSHCLYNYGRAFLTILTNPICFCSILYAIILFHNKIVEPQKTINKKAILLLAVSVVVVTVIMTIAYYLPKLDGISYPEKIYTPVLFLLLATAFVFLCSIISLPLVFRKSRLLDYSKIVLLIIVLCSLIFGENNIANLFRDYKSGRLQNFKRFMDNRIYLLQQVGHSTAHYKIAYVPELHDYPNTVYNALDIETNRSVSKWNKYHEEYFRLDEVRTIGDTTKRFR